MQSKIKEENLQSLLYETAGITFTDEYEVCEIKTFTVTLVPLQSRLILEDKPYIKFMSRKGNTVKIEFEIYHDKMADLFMKAHEEFEKKWNLNTEL